MRVKNSGRSDLRKEIRLHIAGIGKIMAVYEIAPQ